jgi:pimeloyl-ACP methyl ester carboxylesterase
VPWKYVPVPVPRGASAGGAAVGDAVATFVHHRGPTTLPGRPPDTSRGEVVLCLHDAGGNGAVFAALLDALAADHSPLAFDQPGHGRSGSLDSLGAIEAMAAHARGLADALGLASPVLLGDGMGASVALAAAAADPPWPRALVLCGGAAARPAVTDEMVEAVRRVATGKARREFDRDGYAPDVPSEVLQRAFAEWLKTDPRATLGDRLAQQAFDATDRLGAIACPALVVVGEHESPASREAAEALAAGLADATLVELAGAGARGALEQPAALAGRISAFLAERNA